MLHQEAQKIYNTINVPENLLKLILSSRSQDQEDSQEPSTSRSSCNKKRGVASESENTPKCARIAAKTARSHKPKKKQKTKKREGAVKNKQKKVNFELQGNFLFIIIYYFFFLLS